MFAAFQIGDGDLKHFETLTQANKSASVSHGSATIGQALENSDFRALLHTLVSYRMLW